jgi:hypothetical protein
MTICILVDAIEDHTAVVGHRGRILGYIFVLALGRQFPFGVKGFALGQLVVYRCPLNLLGGRQVPHALPLLPPVVLLLRPAANSPVERRRPRL